MHDNDRNKTVHHNIFARNPPNSIPHIYFTFIPNRPSDSSVDSVYRIIWEIRILLLKAFIYIQFFIVKCVLKIHIHSAKIYTLAKKSSCENWSSSNNVRLIAHEHVGLWLVITSSQTKSVKLFVGFILLIGTCSILEEGGSLWKTICKTL